MSSSYIFLLDSVVLRAMENECFAGRFGFGLIRAKPTYANRSIEQAIASEANNVIKPLWHEVSFHSISS
jgi:hypothetical protein